MVIIRMIIEIILIIILLIIKKSVNFDAAKLWKLYLYLSMPGWLCSIKHACGNQSLNLSVCLSVYLSIYLIELINYKVQRL